jgi:hypothetical protein
MLPVALLQSFRDRILPFVVPDPFATLQPNAEYTVHTLGFDTRSLDNYYQKLAGIEQRKKIRVRGYNRITSGSPVFLEVKNNMGGVVTKERSAIPFRDLPEVLETGRVRRRSTSWHDDSAGGDNLQFFFLLHARSFIPVIMSTYEREPYYSRIDREVRITLDKNLRVHDNVSSASLAGASDTTGAMCQYFIVEIKTNGLIPRWLNETLGRFHVVREAISKYTICIEALRTRTGRPYPPVRGIAPRGWRSDNFFD